MRNWIKPLRILLTIATIAILTMPIVALAASDISSANYSGVVRVSNNGTANTSVATTMTLSSADLISQNYVDSAFTRVALRNSSGADVPFMPSINSTIPWSIWVPSIGANTYLNDILYFGTADMTSVKYWFPGASGGSVTDHASLEPSGNFSVTWDGYIDTTAGSGKYLLDKAGAVNVRVSDSTSGNITASLFGSSANWTTFSSVSGTGWTNPTQASDDNLGTRAEYTIGAGAWSDNLTFSLSNKLMGGSIRIRPDRGAGTITTMNVSAYYDGAWTQIYSATPTYAGAYNVIALSTNEDTIQLAVSFYNSAGSAIAYVDEVQIQIPNVSVSATGVTSGEHTANVTQGYHAMNYLLADGDYNKASVANFRSADSSGSIVIWFQGNPLGGALFSSSDEATLTRFLYIEHSSGLRVQQRNNDATDVIRATTTSLSNGDWHNAIVVSTGSAWIIYVDGVLQTLAVDAGANTGDWFADTSDRDNVTFGGRDRGALDAHITANISASYVFSRQIDAAEALSIYQRGRKADLPDTAGLVMSVKFLEGIGNPQDSVGGLNFVNNNSPTWVTDGSLTIAIDGSVIKSVEGATIPDTASNIVFAQNNVSPYVESIDWRVGGNQKGFWEWEYATTFTDQSGNGNTMTPSFRTASSDADVSAALVSFSPITTANAPAFAVSSAPLFITTSISVSSNFTTGNVSGAGFPGSSVVDDAAAVAGVPNRWLWGLMGMMTMALGGLGISGLERKFGSGGGTLFFRILIGISVMGLLIAFGKFDFWMLVLYLMIVITPAMASRHGEIGASPNDQAFIGMLAMLWVGLTVISQVLQGQLLTTDERGFINSLMFTQQFQIGELFSLPIVNFDFFTTGIPTLLRFSDYSEIFSGNAQAIEYLLYSLTAVAGFIVFVWTVGLVTSYVRSR